jgi:hypothetical protein
LASEPPLEPGFTAFQCATQQREKRSHRTHIDERQYEFGLFRVQTDPQMKMAPLARTLFTVTPIQEQLGLILESGKVPVEFIVIDHVERLRGINKAALSDES